MPPRMACNQHAVKDTLHAVLVTGVTSNGEQLEADVVVVAAALGIPELTDPLGLAVPLTAKPRTVTLITKPLKPLLRHIVVTGKLQGPCLLLLRLITGGCDTSHRKGLFCCRKLVYSL